LDGDIVLLLVIIEHISLLAAAKFFTQILVNDVLNFVVPTISVVGLDNQVFQCILDNVSFVLAVPSFVFLVKLVNVLEDCLVSDDFLGAVHSKENSLLQHHEVSLKPRVHDQILDLALCLDVEELTRTTDFTVPDLTHDSSELVVEKEQKSFLVFFGIDCVDFLDENFVLSNLEFNTVLFGLLVADKVHATNGWVGNHALNVTPACLKNLLALMSVVSGNHGFKLN
jgi:hypothetical protein